MSERKPKPKIKVTVKPTKPTKPTKPKVVAKPKPVKPVKPRAAKPKPIKVAPPAEEREDEDDLLSFPLHDLREDAGMLVQQEQNQAILDMLKDLIDVTKAVKASEQDKKKKANHGRRLNSFFKAKDAIASYEGKITSGNQAKKDIPGVGAGIAKRIDEFLKTGTLEELAEHQDPYAKAVMELCGITGIGEVKAQSLINDFNIWSVADLRKAYEEGHIRVAKNQLTHHIAVGLEFYDDLEQRMPWSEADAIAKRVKSTIASLNPELVVNVCGSYRRHKATCGDLDVLVSHPTIDDTGDELPKIVQKLEDDGLLVGHLTSHGKTKYMGVCRLKDGGVGRRIDIRFVNYASLGAATLYFTGSGKFNKIMRFRANERGYTLNEYGLFHYVNRIKGAQIATPTEQDIFKVLNFKYLKPTEREF